MSGAGMDPVLTWILVIASTLVILNAFGTAFMTVKRFAEENGYYFK